MKIFDIENYSDNLERALLIKLDIADFCGKNELVIVNTDDADFASVLKKASMETSPVLLRNDTPSSAAELCRAYPMVNFIVGGFFSKGYTPSSAAELLRSCDNAYLNLSGKFSSINYYLHSLLEKVSTSDRMLFGTAYPFANPAYKKAAVIWEMRDISDKERELILWKNAVRLLGRQE